MVWGLPPGQSPVVEVESMSEGSELQERITKAIHEFLDETGGGFPNSFYFIADICRAPAVSS